MLVDSLRSDFISNPKSGFTFVHSLIEQGKAYSYKAHAHPPTVTLPRIKAIVTGGIPSFSDYLNNFQSSAIDQDNIVWQMQRHSKCIVFYGDDTWLKLFPNSFSRYEGTTSFFVTDTIIVDNNVTRNIGPEMERYRSSRTSSRSNVNANSTTKAQTGMENSKIDSGASHQGSNIVIPPESSSRTLCDANSNWDVMIVHYLGLDHIGHLQGPRSPLMYPKQVEMNGIFESIYKELDDSTLLIMSGDHGMNEEGAHGGPSEGETSPALVLASPVFSNTRDDRMISPLAIDQIDLVPTLSTLIGTPSPLNSVGKLIPDVMHDLYHNQPIDMLRAYQLNSLHIHRLLKTSATICEGGNIQQYHETTPCVGVSESARSAVDQLNEARHAHESFATSSDSRDFEAALHSYRAFLHSSSTLFAHALSEYDDYLLLSAIFGFAVAAFFSILAFKKPLKHHPPLIIILIAAIAHFVADTITLGMIGSSLATFSIRIFVSLLIGYCVAHIILVVQKCFSSIMSIKITDIMTTRLNLKPMISGIWESESEGGLVGFVLLFGLFIRPVAYSSSSFIEEEHLTFFFMCCTAMFALLHHVIAQNGDSSSSGGVFTILLTLFAMRTCRLWNQSGFQGIGQPDVAQMLNRSFPLMRDGLVVMTFVLFVCYVLYHVFRFIERSKSTQHHGGSHLFSVINKMNVNLSKVTLQVWTVCWIFGFFGTFIFQLTGSHSWAQMAHYGYLFAVIVNCFWFFINSSNNSASVGDSLLLFFWSIFGLLILLCRYHNVPLLGLWFLQVHGIVKLSQGFGTGSGKFVDRIKDWMFLGSFAAGGSSMTRNGAIRLPFWIWSLLMFNLGQYAYFSQGNSNSLASIDIAGAYAGLSGYQDGLVGFFVTLLLYSGPLMFQFALLLIFVFQELDSNSNSLSLSPSICGLRSPALVEQPLHLAMLDSLKVRIMGRSWALIIYSIFITLHRGHLFIWSVFAPKLLYEIFHSIAFLIQTVVYLIFGIVCMWFIRRNGSDQTQLAPRRPQTTQNEVHHVHPHHAHEEPFTSHHAVPHYPSVTTHSYSYHTDSNRMTSIQNGENGGVFAV
jgi:predicted AlkP superfamily pyrophosphatase or phosphodiesterase